MRSVLVLAPDEVPDPLARALAARELAPRVVTGGADLRAAASAETWQALVATAPQLDALDRGDLATLARRGRYLLAVADGPVPTLAELPGDPVVIVGSPDAASWSAHLGRAQTTVAWSAKVQHDLRAPLANVLGFAERLQRLAARDTPDRARLQDGLDRVVRNARCGLDLLADLSLLRSLEASGLSCVRFLPMQGPLVRAARGIEPEFERRGVTLVLPEEGATQAESGPGDDPLERALRRLLQDLCKLAGRGGEVRASFVAGEPPELEVTAARRDSTSSAVRGDRREGLDTLLARGLVEAVGGTLRAADPGDGAAVVYRLAGPRAT